MNAHKAVGALRMLNVARRTAQSVQSYVHLPPQLYAAAHAQQCLRCFSQGEPALPLTCPLTSITSHPRHLHQRLLWLPQRSNTR